VVLKTDSDYLRKSMTEWIWNWMGTGGVGSDGEVKHWHYPLQLHQRIIEVETAKRIRVLFWRVPREYHQTADALVNLAFDQEESTFASNVSFVDGVVDF
jgi:ribonuclease HI